ncbi:MAG: hypothetical protein AAB444_02710 [Patescibacteria group bacterium]
MIPCSHPNCGLLVDQDGVCPKGHPSLDANPREGHDQPPRKRHREAVVGVRCTICGAHNDECGTCNNMHTAHEQLRPAA